MDLRSGTIIKAEEFSRAKKPSYKIWADFGPEIGILQTSAQVTVHYTLESLINRSIVGCINLDKKILLDLFLSFCLLDLLIQMGLYA